MLIYVKKKRKVFHRTDRWTDGRSTQNYSSEPHKSREGRNIPRVNKVTSQLSFTDLT